MKKNICCFIIALGIIGGLASPCFAQNTGAKIIFRDLPGPVQKAIRSDKEDIKRIEQFTYDGKTVYEVRLDKEDASDKLIYLTQDGTPIKDKAVRLQRQADRSKLHLKNLPKTVQDTYKKEAGSAKMEDIDVDTINGKTVYDIDYNRAGRLETVRINEDGSLVRSNRRGARLNNGESRLGRAEVPNAASFDRSLSGSRKLDFESAPEAVKRTARSVAGSNRIEDAERGTLDGRTVYELAFKENGVHNELRVAEDGSIVQRIGGGTQFGSAAPVKMTADQVPAPVRRVIKAQVGSGEVNDIDKMTVGGRTVYEVGFKREKGGVQHEMQIAEDGTIIREPAGARKK